MRTMSRDELIRIGTLTLAMSFAYHRFWPGILLAFAVASLIEWRTMPKDYLGPVGMIFVVIGGWLLLRFGAPAMYIALVVWIGMHACRNLFPASTTSKPKPVVDPSLD